ncbi:MAG TPA: hypothetical protein VF650_07955 [Allosphingosinicella sp.]|jgi:hypothetical protein
MVLAVPFLAALAFAAPAAAPLPPSGGDEIVVTGNRDAEREVRDFVKALAPASPFEQLSRFEWEVCPAAVGVSPSQKQALARRIRQVAAAAGIRLAAADCSPNVLLVVASDKKAFIQALAKRHPDYIGNMPPRAFRRLVSQPGPAAAWQVDGPLLNADGQPIGAARLTGPGFDADATAYFNDTTRTTTRVSAGARPHFTAAVVVVEGKALEGLTTTQLADYAAMRAFARTDPSRLKPNAPPTILKILEAPMGSEVPLTLTPRDLGFLRGLYASKENLFAGSQRGVIRKAIEEEMRGEKEERRD